jgi:hypothetical protein
MNAWPNSGVSSQRIVAAQTHGEQQRIVAEDGGKCKCAANSNGSSQRMRASECVAEQLRIVAEDRATHQCTAEQQRIVAEDRGTHECAAKQRRIVAKEKGTRECTPSSDGSSQRIGARVNARQTASMAENRTEGMPSRN